jgi:excisionase family DNA binding protein
MDRRTRVLRKSGFGSASKGPDLLACEPFSLGQCCPQHCPPPDPMGAPLSIREAARVIGCSPWTVRQKLMPRGLPHFRSGGGKLLFYTNQIIRWIESQQKGNV